MKKYILILFLFVYTSLIAKTEPILIANTIKSIDSLYEINPKAKTIYISSVTEQTKLNKEIYKFLELETLICDGAINKIPCGISRLSNLKILSLKFCLIKELPEDIVKLGNLVKLDLMNSNLTKLPKNIGNFKRLKSLLLGGTQLKLLPESIQEIKSLEEIMFCTKYLSKLPLFLMDMPWLKIIYLNICKGKSKEMILTKEIINEFKKELKIKLPKTLIY